MHASYSVHQALVKHATVTQASGAYTHQVHYPLLEQIGGQVWRRLVCCIALQRRDDLQSSQTTSFGLLRLC